MTVDFGRYSRIIITGGVSAVAVWMLLPPREITRDVVRPEPPLIGGRLYGELTVDDSNAAALRAVPVDDIDAWEEARRIHAILDDESWKVANSIGGVAPDAYLRHFAFTDFGPGLHAEEALTQRKAESNLVRLRNILQRHGHCISGPPKLSDVQAALDKLMAQKRRESPRLSGMTPKDIDLLGDELLGDLEEAAAAPPAPTQADIGDWKPSVDAVAGCWRKLPGLIREWSDGEFLEIRRYERGVQDRTAESREGLASATFSRLMASPNGLHANGPRGYSYSRFVWTRITEDLMVVETRGEQCPLLPTVEVYQKTPC